MEMHEEQASSLEGWLEMGHVHQTVESATKYSGYIVALHSKHSQSGTGINYVGPPAL